MTQTPATLKHLYRSLQKNPREIRLLLVYPATGESQYEPIRCSFTNTSLNAPCAYEALSYVWGKPGGSRTVDVQGHTVPVTDNLFIALRNLRDEKEVRTLWIDALCINQSDLDERTHQVAQMRYIYQEAATVVIFLGQSWAGSEMAVEFLDRTGTDKDLHYSSSLGPHVIVQGQTTASEDLREHIIQLFNLDWWKRVWTVQEFVLAKELCFQLGKWKISGDVVLQSFANVNAHDNDCCANETCFMEIDETSGICVWDAFTRLDMLAFKRSDRDRYTFLQTLAAFRMRRCFDPRDKIYGMLGLATGDWDGFIQPDYEQPIEDLLRKVVFEAINRTGSLGVFSHAYGKREPGSILPSYVPDWTAEVEELFHTAALSRTYSLSYFDASESRKAAVREGPEHTLICKGVLYDTIIQVEISRADDEAGISHSLLENWISIAQMSSKGANMWEAMCGGLSCAWDDGNHYWQRANAVKEEAKYEMWQEWIKLGRPESHPSHADISDFDNAHLATSQFRRFARTEEGHIGFVPLDTKVGDRVGVLLGGRVPFILRDTQQNHGGEQRYFLVGDCNLTGIMNGECFSSGTGDVTDICLT